MAAFAFIVLFSATSQANIDLEESFRSNIVKSSKQIEIPGYPGAFNPSIIRYQGSLLLSFRFIPERKDNMTSYLGVVFLNDDLSLAGDVRILNLRRDSKVKSRAEDARLITIGDRLYVVYSDNRDLKITKGGFRVYIVQLHFENGEIILNEPEGLTEFEGNNPDLREKNWVAFESDGQMKMAYSINPHVILQPRLDGSGICDTIAKTCANTTWTFGEIRGGTPGFLVGDEYLAFFHSSQRFASTHTEGKDMMHYFMGAYTFHKDMPHHLTSLSKVPIVGDGFYSGEQFKGFWKPVRAIFAGEFVFDDDNIWVAYGKDDHQVWVANLDRKALMSSLERIEK